MPENKNNIQQKVSIKQKYLAKLLVKYEFALTNELYQDVGDLVENTCKIQLFRPFSRSLKSEIHSKLLIIEHSWVTAIRTTKSACVDKDIFFASLKSKTLNIRVPMQDILGIKLQIGHEEKLIQEKLKQEKLFKDKANAMKLYQLNSTLPKDRDLQDEETRISKKVETNDLFKKPAIPKIIDNDHQQFFDSVNEPTVENIESINIDNQATVQTTTSMEIEVIDYIERPHTSKSIPQEDESSDDFKKPETPTVNKNDHRLNDKEARIQLDADVIERVNEPVLQNIDSINPDTATTKETTNRMEIEVVDYIERPHTSITASNEELNGHAGDAKNEVECEEPVQTGICNEPSYEHEATNGDRSFQNNELVFNNYRHGELDIDHMQVQIYESFNEDSVNKDWTNASEEPSNLDNPLLETAMTISQGRKKCGRPTKKRLQQKELQKEPKQKKSHVRKQNYPILQDQLAITDPNTESFNNTGFTNTSMPNASQYDINNTDDYSIASINKVEKAWRGQEYEKASKQQQYSMRQKLKDVILEKNRFLARLGLCLGHVDLHPIPIYGDTSNMLKLTINKETAVPRKPRQNSQKQIKTELDKTLKVKKSKFGVYLTIENKLKVHLDNFFERKYGTGPILDEDFTDSIIQLRLVISKNLDYKDLNAVNVSFSIINDVEKCKTADGNYTLGIYEYDEADAAENGHLRIVLADLTREIETIDEITVRNKNVKVLFYIGGNWKQLCHYAGIQFKNSSYPCIWCKCKIDELHCADMEWSISDRFKGARTLDEQRDILISSDSKSSIVNYGYEIEPIFSYTIPASHYVIDIQYLYSSISECLLKCLINDCCKADDFSGDVPIEKFDLKNYKHLHALERFITETCQAKFSISLTNKNSTQYKYNTLKWSPLSNEDRTRVVSHLDLSKIIPDHSKFESISRLWTLFKDIFELIREIEINEDDLKTSTAEWLRIFLSVYSESSVTVQIHTFTSHLHEFIRFYPNINAFNNCVAEKLNSGNGMAKFRGKNKRTLLLKILKNKNESEIISAIQSD